MRITIPHNLSKDEARRRLEQRLGDLVKQFGHYASDLEQHWNGDRMDFGFKAKGISGKGSVEITDSEVIIEGKLPLMAKPFEPRIRSAIEREAESVFRTA
ncbi:MAG TPA: polyhydroxyalkanoic acid system family protein [Thermoanaerobaculia bacterium]|nr:polyhydroxyalkanoic acid system family protein [Thermoanaerobaculia bacterium]